MSPSAEAAVVEVLLKVWGPSGAIILAQLAAIAFLFRGYTKCQNQRVEEAKQNAAANMAVSKEINSTLGALTEAIHMMIGGQ